jgi:hypothetical protein
METKIYALLDENNKLRYIGKTINSLKDRLEQHIKSKEKTYKTNWISSMRTLNLIPNILLIGEVIGNGNKEEIAWISYGKEEGWNLTNCTNGGDGVSKGNIPWNLGKKGIMTAWNKGIPCSDKTKKKLSKYFKGKPGPNKGRIFSPTARHNMSVAHLGTPNINKGKHLPQETKTQISNTLKNKYKTGEFINPNLGKILRQETKDKIKNTLKEKYKTGEIQPATLGKHWTLSIETRNKMILAKKGVKRGKYKIS